MVGMIHLGSIQWNHHTSVSVLTWLDYARWCMSLEELTQRVFHWRLLPALTCALPVFQNHSKTMKMTNIMSSTRQSMKFTRKNMARA